MVGSPRIIAKKYAVAFVDLYKNDLSSDFLEKFSGLAKFLKENRYLYIYLRIPSISIDIKIEVLNHLIKTFGLFYKFKKLMYLLLEQDRIEILDKVLMQIISYYREIIGEELFHIFSSHQLNQEEKEKVIDFIKFHSSKKVKTKFFVDEKLIVGLRIQSNTFLWERSIAKQLRDVKQFMHLQAGL